MPTVRVISTPYSLSYLEKGNFLLPGDKLSIQKVERYYLEHSIDTYFIINPKIEIYTVGGTKEDISVDLPIETLVLYVDRQEENCDGN